MNKSRGEVMKKQFQQKVLCVRIRIREEVKKKVVSVNVVLGVGGVKTFIKNCFKK